MLEFLQKKYIGIDLFYNQIKVIDYKEGIIFNENIKNFYDSLPMKSKTDRLLKHLNNSKYSYHPDSIYIIFKNLLKILPDNFFKPVIILAIPTEIKYSNYGELWIKNLEETLFKCNIDSLILVEGVICAAYSLSIPFYKPKYNNLFGKYLIIHQTPKATIIGLLFNNSTHNLRIIEKSPNDITYEEIASALVNILDDKNYIPEELTDKNIPNKNRDILTKSWHTSWEKTINLVAPLQFCDDFGNYIDNHFDDYKINCCEDFNNNTIKGLENILATVYSEKYTPK